MLDAPAEPTLSLDLSEANLRAWLPHDQPRPGQLEAVHAILSAFMAGKRYVFFEGPCGSGKSGIALAVARALGNSMYLTTLKVQQDQLANSYSAVGQVPLKGRATYPCDVLERHPEVRDFHKKDLAAQELFDSDEMNCENSYCQKVLRKPKCGLCAPLGRLGQAREIACPYYRQVSRADAAAHALLNFSSYLHQRHMAGRFPDRRLLILDEAHQCETQILKFVELSLDDRTLSLVSGLPGPPLRSDPEAVRRWALQHEALDKIQEATLVLARREEDPGAAEQVERLQHLYFSLAGFLRSMDDGSPWVMSSREERAGPWVGQVAVLQPVYAGRLARTTLLDHGHYVLLLSATILDLQAFSCGLGFDLSEAEFLRLPSYFPPANRPVYLRSAGRFTGGRQAMEDNWGPKLVAGIDEIVEHYAGYRGVIHTHSHAIADYVCRYSRFAGRFRQQRAGEDLTELVQVQQQRLDSVLVGPGLGEGLDLKDDKARFQILCKTPWPDYFSDPQLARRKELDPAYVKWLVAVKTIQSTGRAVRSEDDWAHTYLLDSGFRDFFKSNRKLLPEWFQAAVVDEG